MSKQVRTKVRKRASSNGNGNGNGKHIDPRKLIPFDESDLDTLQKF